MSAIKQWKSVRKCRFLPRNQIENPCMKPQPPRLLSRQHRAASRSLVFGVPKRFHNMSNDSKVSDRTLLCIIWNRLRQDLRATDELLRDIEHDDIGGTLITAFQNIQLRVWKIYQVSCIRGKLACIMNNFNPLGRGKNGGTNLQGLRDSKAKSKRSMIVEVKRKE